jgi:hypothetical protein
MIQLMRGSGALWQAAQHILQFAEDQTCTDTDEFVHDMKQLFGHRCRGYNTGKWGKSLLFILSLPCPGATLQTVTRYPHLLLMFGS